jgi:hypothetical protein
VDNQICFEIVSEREQVNTNLTTNDTEHAKILHDSSKSAYIGNK